MNNSVHYLLHSGKNSKQLYYLRAALSDALPDGCFRARLRHELEYDQRTYDEDYIEDGVCYYCKLAAPVPLGDNDPRWAACPRKATAAPTTTTAEKSSSGFRTHGSGDTSSTPNSATTAENATSPSASSNATFPSATINQQL